MKQGGGSSLNLQIGVKTSSDLILLMSGVIIDLSSEAEVGQITEASTEKHQWESKKDRQSREKAVGN